MSAKDESVQRISGDEAVGFYSPPLVATPAFTRLADDRLALLRKQPGLVATASDILDELGFQLAVASAQLPCRTPGTPVMVGHAITLLYQPARRTQDAARRAGLESRLAHHALFRRSLRGDVAVIGAPYLETVSVFGGIAAVGAVAAGISGCVVDGGIRDLAQIESSGIGAWARAVTPRTGKWRAEAAALNVPVVCGGVQVQPGDLVLADTTGVCFVPESVADQIATRVLEICAAEAAVLARTGPTNAR